MTTASGTQASHLVSTSSVGGEAAGSVATTGAHDDPQDDVPAENC
jgi:hypothetical protein